MRSLYKEFENVSAYLDDELSSTERARVEENLKTSEKLKSRFRDYRMVKDRVSGIRPLPEDYYFEQRLVERIRNNKPSKFGFFKKKPVIAFAVLAIGFMVVFKTNPQVFTNFLSEQKDELMELYTDNLRPIIFSDEITNADIFNFAFNKMFPIDKEKDQMLELSRDEDGNQIIEVKYASAFPTAINLELFVKSLNLNTKQKVQVDSILESYSDDIGSSVLVNDKSVVVVNPQIWHYQNALKADLLSFAANTNKLAAARIFPVEIKPDVIRNYSEQVIRGAEDGNKNIYCFITPDSVFYHGLEIDKQKMKKEIEEFKRQMKVNKEELKKLRKFKIDVRVIPPEYLNGKTFKIDVDSNRFKVEIPDKLLGDDFMDSLNIVLDDALIHLKDFNMGLKMDSIFKKNKDSWKDWGDSVRDNSKKLKEKLKKEGFGPDFDAQKFEDELRSSLKFYFNDSLRIELPKQLNQEMEAFREQMENLRKEMDNLQKELQKKRKSDQPKSPVEI
ncbi:MAG: hypothetical protein GX452_08295 [Ignavibacteriales bacterium]|nr:hypothetical protein [Ignavibacteriales bacterium]